MRSQHSDDLLMASGRAKHFLFSLLLLLSVSVLAISDRAYAEPNTSSTVEFNIPGQTVPAALNEFARQARVQLFFITEGFENVRANEVVGTFPRQEALQRLLEGTGLKANYTPDALIKVAPAEDSTSSAILRSNGLALASADTPSDRMIAQAIDEDRNVPAAQRGAPVANDEENDEVREEVIVTGSRIRGAQSASPVVTISHQEIDRVGFATVEEVMYSLPQNFGAGVSLTTFTDLNSNTTSVGSNVENIGGGTSVNLRGLGAGGTLILLNGRRMTPSGRSARFTDISSIPVNALERVEVLTDGASAIYGSDAIGGVVNFILRDDYEGAETRLRYGSDSGGDTLEVLFGQSFGKSWDDGNILFSYEYYNHDSLANSDRNFASSQDLTRFGGTDWRSLTGGNPANISAGGQLWAIPAGQDGTSLTAADFDSAAAPNLLDEREFEFLIPEHERHSIFLNVSQDIGAAEVFADVRYSRREDERPSNFTRVDFDVPNTNPFFVDPTGTGLTSVTISQYSFSDDLGPRIITGETESYGGTLGVRFDMGENWNGELVGTWSKAEETQGNNGAGNVDMDALNSALNQTDPDLAFNPFGDGSNTNAAVLDTLPTGIATQGNFSENELKLVGFNVDGTIFDVSGGPVQIATGIEYREESLVAFQDPAAPELGTNTNRDVLAVYAELFLPLVSDSNSRPGLRRLELSLAGRYTDYSDFGDTTDPKVGLAWSPTESLTLRGTWGTSFKAPSLFDLDVSDPNTNVVFLFPGGILPFVPVNTLVLLGGSENLRAEEATSWTAGFEWRPERVKGLALDVTYFNIDFEDRIDRPLVAFFDAIGNPRFSSITTTMPTLEQIATFVDDPRYQDFFGVPAADLISGVVPVDVIVNNRNTNLSQSVVTGADVNLSYDFETALGLFDFGLSGSYLFDYERAFVDTDPLLEEVDTLGRPVDFRARGSVTWSRQEWSVSGFVKYVDGFTDNQSVPSKPVDSWTTVDLTFAYETGDNRGFLSNTRFSLVAQNLFDEDPPFADTFGGVAFDSSNHSPLGRFVSFQITKDW